MTVGGMIGAVLNVPHEFEIVVVDDGGRAFSEPFAYEVNHLTRTVTITARKISTGPVVVQ